MAYVIGIDTGGTYTDTVLLRTKGNGAFSVEKKAKAFTTKDNLEIGIGNSITGLALSADIIEKIDKVVLSTTLATNAIVENVEFRVGLIVIGDRPSGKLATEHVKVVKGKMNIKGRVIVNINEESVKRTVRELQPYVDAIAVTGLASVRNPVQEQQIKKIIHELTDLPVVCGHELVADLGYLDRTNTAVINAGLLPIINRFVDAIMTVLERENIKAPVFLVKGDGNITEINTIKSAPVETVLSGPAASMIGAIRLTGVDHMIIADMGGTTTDTGRVVDRRIELSRDGATIGKWKIKIRSAKLSTFGLGGDSEITVEHGRYHVGPRRVLPSCRGGNDNVTPTDILHYTGEFIEWNRDELLKTIETRGDAAGEKTEDFAKKCETAIIEKLYHDNTLIKEYPWMPVCAIGAPAKAWYSKAKDKYGFQLIIPSDFDVANAVGAAAAEVCEKMGFVIRPGEEGYGYLLHTKIERLAFRDKTQAIKTGVERTVGLLIDKIHEQGLEAGTIDIICEEISEGEEGILRREIQIRQNGTVDPNDVITENYLETRVSVSVQGVFFTDHFK